MKPWAPGEDVSSYIVRIEAELDRITAERDALFGYVNGLLGLLQMVRRRADMPAAIGDVLRFNHRVVDPAAYLTQIVPPETSALSDAVEKGGA